MLWTALIWFIVWGTIGGVVTPRIYTRKDLDVSQASLAGTAIGAALGPIFVYAFAQTYPENLCVVNGGFVASQLTNGIVIGIIYGLMALGLTLIYSILGVVSFAHGEFYMIGGMVVYYIEASYESWAAVRSSAPKSMPFWSPLASPSFSNTRYKRYSVPIRSKPNASLNYQC